MAARGEERGWGGTWGGREGRCPKLGCTWNRPSAAAPARQRPPNSLHTARLEAARAGGLNELQPITFPDCLQAPLWWKERTRLMCGHQSISCDDIGDDVSARSRSRACAETCTHPQAPQADAPQHACAFTQGRLVRGGAQAGAGTGCRIAIRWRCGRRGPGMGRRRSRGRRQSLQHPPLGRLPLHVEGRVPLLKLRQGGRNTSAGCLRHAIRGSLSLLLPEACETRDAGLRSGMARRCSCAERVCWHDQMLATLPLNRKDMVNGSVRF